MYIHCGEKPDHQFCLYTENRGTTSDETLITEITEVIERISTGKVLSFQSEFPRCVDKNSVSQFRQKDLSLHNLFVKARTTRQ